MFESVLIANRGEIAVRIIRACRALGIRPIAVYSEVDAGALWTRIADEAHCIGPAPAKDSYLNIERIVETALQCGAQAIHPGYGLLSESSEFAESVTNAGLTFVGPTAELIAIMGDKVTARHAARTSGIPVLSGSDGPIADQGEALSLAESIGLPIAVKASFGGGGRGLRVVHDIEQLTAALEQSSRESLAAFGRNEVFLERYLENPRHIEVQILSDGQGKVIHLGDRDCSVQRRFQKLLEEAPAPGLTADLTQRIRQAAVKLCSDVSYSGAGTVEFLASPAKDEFYFLEMNTRLQVEHGVTELVTGIDIVIEQLRIASGQGLSIDQDDIEINGHAIQARITAEDPWEDFRPVPGAVDKLTLPLGPWLRLDFGIESGDAIPGHYDSMFGKIQAWGRNRSEACDRLKIGLSNFAASGISTSAPYLKTILTKPDFREVSHDTSSLERNWLPDPDKRPDQPSSAPPITQMISAKKHSERIVSVPWAGRLIDVAVFGTIRKTAPGAEPVLRRRREQSSKADNGTDRSGIIVSPMDAVVTQIACKPGDEIRKGEPFLTLEAMKMEVAVPAAYDCRVLSIDTAFGAQVKNGGALLAVEPLETAAL